MLHPQPAVLLENSLYWVEAAGEDKDQGVGLADLSQPCIHPQQEQQQLKNKQKPSRQGAF